jgi:hypothetical protein
MYATTLTVVEKTRETLKHILYHFQVFVEGGG